MVPIGALGSGSNGSAVRFDAHAGLVEHLHRGQPVLLHIREFHVAHGIFRVLNEGCDAFIALAGNAAGPDSAEAPGPTFDCHSGLTFDR